MQLGRFNTRNDALTYLIIRMSMKPKAFEKYRIGDKLEITWLDTNSPEKDSWFHEDDFVGSKNVMKIKSLSFYFGIKGKFVNIASDRMQADPGEFNLLINRRLSIPLGCITRVKKIK